MIEERAYAKINLALLVGGLNSNNYHDVKNIMVPIDLYDTITFQLIDKEIILMDNTNIEVEKNLVYKAAKLFLETYKIKSGVLINLNKVIPAEAGLAGGSADAAATLRGLNRLFNLDRNLDELAQLAASLGSDVPYCIYQRPSICTGTGTDVQLLLTNYPKWNVLLVKPPFGCSTKDIYQRYRAGRTDLRERRLQKVIDALTDGDLNLLTTSMFNDLEKPAFELNNDLQNIKNEIGNKVPSMMSGSGSTIFAISEDKKILEEIALEESKYCKTILTKLL